MSEKHQTFPSAATPAPQAEERWHQIDYPKILYVCEICSESNSEACGNDRDHINVTPDGRWLCADCLDDEGIDVSVCRDAPKLFAALAATEGSADVSEPGEHQEVLDAIKSHNSGEHQ